MPASKIKGKCAANTEKIPPVHFYAVHLISRLKNFDKLESKCCINVRSLELLHTGKVSVSFCSTILYNFLECWFHYELLNDVKWFNEGHGLHSNFQSEKISLTICDSLKE